MFAESVIVPALAMMALCGKTTNPPDGHAERRVL